MGPANDGEGEKPKNTAAYTATEPLLLFRAYQVHPVVRHRLIFEILTILPASSTLRLLNDHDPVPVRYQLEAEYPGQYTYHALDDVEGWWAADITRLPTVAPT